MIYWRSFIITLNSDSLQSLTVYSSRHSLLDNDHLPVYYDERRIPAHTLNCLVSREHTNSLLTYDSKSKSKSHCDLRSVSKSWCRALSVAHDQIFITVWQLRSCSLWALSLTRGRVCLLYMMLALASVVFLGSESFGTRDHILFSDSGLPFSSSPTTHSIKVGVFNPASTRVWLWVKSKSHCDWRSVSQ
jgi:hypothetical protein